MLLSLSATSGQVDLPVTLQGGQAFRWRATSEGYDGVLDGNIVLLTSRPGGLEVASAPAPPEAILPHLRAYLRLEDNLPAIWRDLDVDPYIHHALGRYPGLRLLRQDPWECLIAFICSAISNIPQISRAMEAIAQAYGGPVSLGSLTRHAFPSPERLSAAGEQALRGLGVGFRARYLASAARMVATGELDLNALRGLPYEEARSILLQVPGVGDKVADCVLLFSLDKLEAFPIDRWVSRALWDWYPELGRRPYRELRQWAVAHFGPCAGYAQLYLFQARRAAGHAPRVVDKPSEAHVS